VTRARTRLTISLTKPANHAEIGRSMPRTEHPTTHVRTITTAESAHELPTSPEIQSKAAPRISPENRL
jgi:hypothetical protein